MVLPRDGILCIAVLVNQIVNAASWLPYEYFFYLIDLPRLIEQIRSPQFNSIPTALW
jgi:hypothetical protein